MKVSASRVVTPRRPDGTDDGDAFRTLGISPDDLPDGLVVADETGQVVCFNRAASRITGIDRDEAVGKDIAEALPLETLDGTPWWRCVDPYGGLRIRTGHTERRLLLPGGRDVLVSASYVRDHTRSGPGELRRLVVGLRDTSMRARVDRGHAELIATVAHELRSPLTSVKGFTATLLAKWSRFTDEQKRLMLETVDADADRVTRLIAELLDIARIDSGRLQLRRAPIDVGTLVREHVAALVAAGQPPERFDLTIADPLPVAQLDADKMRQVVANLLENAVRHGGGTVTVLVEPERLPEGREAVAVTVSDQGGGIPEEFIGRVFTKFWRGNRRGGTGLGLYIVKGLIEAHGGTIVLGRAPGGGAQFRFTVPAG